MGATLTDRSRKANGQATWRQNTGIATRTGDPVPDQDENRATVVPIVSEGDVMVARRVTLKVSAPLGFSVVDLTNIETATSELATNLVRYAIAGRLSVRCVEKDDSPGIEIKATDEGPGIEDIKQAMTDGFSTGRSLGVGLPAVKRLMDEFDIVKMQTIHGKILFLYYGLIRIIPKKR